MYYSPQDKTGRQAFNALSAAMLQEFGKADDLGIVLPILKMQEVYRSIAKHNPSSTCYCAAHQIAVNAFREE